MRNIGSSIEWTAVSDQWPPFEVWILTFCARKDWPDMQTNALRVGSGKCGRQPGLYYWDSGDDFFEVTHWAPLPKVPAP